MSVRELLKSVGLVALAAGSLVALPVEVLAKGNRDWSGDGGGGRHHGGGRGGDGGGAQRAQRQQQAQLPQVQAPQVQVPNVQYRQQHMPRQVDAPAQVQWRGNRDAGQAQNIRPRQQRQWSGEGGGQPRRLRQPDAAVPDAGRVERGRVHGGDRGSRQIRNRSYVDPGRNGSYRDGNRDNNWRDNNWSDGDRHGGDRSRWNGGRHGHNDGWRGGDKRRWSNNWRHDNRYDWHGHRNRHGNRYRLGSYYAPYRNYYYSPLSIGLFMDSLFFSSNYWISDPYEYRLPPVYGPYRWVRYYDDVVLVDIYSGEVVDVIRNFFW